MAHYRYEGPAPTRDQCQYFRGELAGLRDFWSRRDAMRVGLNEQRFGELCDELDIPMVIRGSLWYEVVTD